MFSKEELGMIHVALEEQRDELRRQANAIDELAEKVYTQREGIPGPAAPQQAPFPHAYDPSRATCVENSTCQASLHTRACPKIGSKLQSTNSCTLNFGCRAEVHDAACHALAVVPAPGTVIGGA